MSYILHNTIPFHAPLEEDFESVIARAVEEGSLDDLLIIVPTGRRVRLLRRIVIRSIHRKSGKPVGEMPIYTLEQFVRHCAKLLYGARCPRLLSEAYLLALMEEAAGKADLKFFKGRQQTLSPTALARMANVIWGLKEDGVTPHSLRDDLRRATLGEEDIDAARLGDITALYEMYEAILGSQFADYPRILQYLAQALQGERDTATGEHIPIPDDHPLSIMERWEQIFPGKKGLFLDGFSEFKKPEQEFLALLAFAPFHSRIYLDFSEQNGPLFSNFQETLQDLQLSGFKAFSPDREIERRDGYTREKHLPLVSYLRRWLFNTEQDIRHHGFGEMIQVLGVENRLEEVRAIAKLIRKLTLQDGVPLSEVSVVMRQPERYSALFREMLALYNIPANITDRYPLEKSPVVIAVFAVLDIVLLGFRRNDVHRALQSPYIRFTRPEMGRDIPLDAANLYEVAQRLRINGGDRNGGVKGWMLRFEKRLEYLNRRLHFLRNESYPDSDEIRQTTRELEETIRAQKDFETLVNLLPVAESLTPVEFADMIRERILERLQVRECIAEFHRHARQTIPESSSAWLQLQEEVEKDARAFSAFLALVDEMAYVFQERFPDRRHTMQEYLDRLRTAVRAERYQPREKVGYGVTVTAIEQIRNTPFLVTILCGAIDGEFPAAYTPESFLGKELKDSEDRFLKRERLQFYLAITNHPRGFEDGKKKVFITYPLFRGNDNVVRSSFVDALLKVTPLHEAECVLDMVQLRQQRMQSPDVQQWQRIEWIDALANKDELMNSVGKYGVHGAPRQEILSLPEAPSTALPSPEQELFACLKQHNHEEEAHRILSHCKERIDGIPAVAIQPEKLTLAAKAGLELYANKPYSISHLEDYSKCPYQYFAHRVLLLREQEEYDTNLSPLERGNILHKILYRFYRELQEEQIRQGEIKVIKAKNPELPPIALVQLDPEFCEEYDARLKSIAQEEIEHIQFDHPFFELDKEELLGNEHRIGKLDIWLQEELKRAGEGWSFQPGLFEFGFGGTSAMSEQTDIPPVEISPSLKLRGKIDRVELQVHESGVCEVLVADYKIGKPDNLPRNIDIIKGLSLQMPLYIAAIQTILRQYYGLESISAGGAYYSLSPVLTKHDGGRLDSHRFVLLPRNSSLGRMIPAQRAKAQTVADSAETEQCIAQSAGHASRYVANITDGLFAVQPHDRKKTCEWCSYETVCRIKETATE